MAVSMLREMLRVLGRCAEAGKTATDAQLLRRYVQSQDEAAFTELVHRHGPMVLGVCRRLLRDEATAEDAFQATFLVLVRRAGGLCWQESIAGWLHEVAWRVAHKARRRPAHHSLQEPAMTPDRAAEDRDLEPGEILEEALASLPRHYRNVLVLCCREGKSNEEAAVALGCPVGTVKSRLARGRELLRRRLLRRGVAAPAAVAVSIAAGPSAEASVSPRLFQTTIEQAVAFAKGTAAGGAPAVLLARAVLHGFAISRVGLGVGLALCGALLLLGAAFAAGVFTPPIPGAEESALLAVGPPVRRSGAPALPAVPNDLEERDEPAATPQPASSLETPLPRGAVARLGTTRYRSGETFTKLKLSPDGKKLLTFGGVNGVIAWDARTGKQLLRRPLGWEGELSPDGERLFVIEFLPSRPGAKSKPAAGPGAMLDFLQDIGDGKNVKTALKVYQISTGKLLRRIDNPRWLAHFVLSPDERTLALVYAVPNGATAEQAAGRGHDYLFDSHLELYDLKAGRISHKLGKLPRSYSGAALVRFSADGKSLFAVTCSEENKNKPESTVRRFDVATGALQSKKTIPDSGYTMPPGLDRKKTLIVSGTMIWDLEKERKHWSSRGELSGVYSFMPDGRTLVGWSRMLKPFPGADIASQVVHWDMATDREIRRLPPRTSLLAVAPDGKTCFGSAWTYRWYRWEFAGGKELDAVDAPTAPPDPIVFSRDGKYAAILFGIWDRATGKLLRHLPTPLPGGGPFFFTPDSKSLVYGAGGATLYLLEMGTWKQVKREFERADPFGNNFAVSLDTTCCRLSLDGKVLARPTAAWSWANGKLLGKLEHQYPGGIIGQLGPIALSPDGKQLTCVASLAPAPKVHVQVWNLVDRKLIHNKSMADWPKEPVRSLQLLADGKLLAAVWLPPRPPWRGMMRWPEEQLKPIPKDWPATRPPVPDGVLRVWDVETGKEKYRLTFPQQWDNSAVAPVCSPDGKLAVTASYHDSLVRFWNLASGKEVGRFRCPVSGVYGLAFSPDGKVLAVSAKDTTVLLVDVAKVAGK
jgi:RNA polymerase sigma factor (sigma-70 family)